MLKDNISSLIENGNRLWGQGQRIGCKTDESPMGTCNIRAKRVWLNLELAKELYYCLEFIVMREMTHLLERHHKSGSRCT